MDYHEKHLIAIQAQIDILTSLKYTDAYTGDLSDLKQKSYVEYLDVLKLLNEKRKSLKALKNMIENELIIDFLKFKESIQTTIRGGEVMYDVPGHYKYLEEHELFEYFINNKK